MNGVNFAVIDGMGAGINRFTNFGLKLEERVP
jgi:hypothetical protein